MLKVREVRTSEFFNKHGDLQFRWEIFTTPEDVKAALEEQGDYPEICLTIQEEE